MMMTSFFLWCHVRHLNLNCIKPNRITEKDQEISKNLNYDGIKFPVSKTDYCKIEVMNKININVFCHEDKIIYLVDKIIYLVYLSDQNLDDNLDLLFVCNHYALIKDFNRLIFSKTKNKKSFCKSCLCCFSCEFILNKHKKDCLLINGGQTLKLEK